jgi:hypothetical protein
LSWLGIVCAWRDDVLVFEGGCGDDAQEHGLYVCDIEIGGL